MVPFTDVDELCEWLKTQSPDKNNKIRPFAFNGHVVGTIIDSSLIPKWGRI